MGGFLRHDDRNGEVVAKRAHQLWKYCSGLSAAVSMVIFGFSVAGWFWHSWGESEHQKEIDEWDIAEREVAGEHPNDPIVIPNDIMEDADEDSNMFVDPYKVWEKH